MKRSIYTLLFCLLAGIAAQAQNDRTTQHDTTAIFKVYGVCTQCKHRIEEAMQVKGIAAADWNVDTKMLTVTYNAAHISLEKINNKIAAAGHDTYYKKADDADYYALPKCCYYRQFNSMADMKHAKDSTADTTSNVAVTNETAQYVKGVVLEEDKKGAFRPLTGASVVWL